ncbi:DMT family transporter [Spiractinospora alimapuensis]|nr:DMT family transporter [Spiractinospora alimapuensis]
MTTDEVMGSGVPRGQGGPETSDRPQRSAVLRMIGSAACTSSSGAFVKLGDVTAGTAAFLRCALALPVLLPMALRERRRHGPRPTRLHVTDVAAGLLLGVDYVFWAAAVHHVGAGIAAVLINIQVVIFPLLAWMVSGTRLNRRFLLSVPVMLFGVALSAGALGNAEPGSDPIAGAVFGVAAGISYAGYLFLLRRGGEGKHVATPVFTSTAAAAVAAVALGLPWTGIQLDLSWQTWGWMILLALAGQVLAWILAAEALPRLTPNVGATLLLLQPVLAVLIGLAFLAERPTASQYVGCVLVVVAIWQATRVPKQRAGG